VSPKESSF